MMLRKMRKQTIQTTRAHYSNPEDGKCDGKNNDEKRVSERKRRIERRTQRERSRDSNREKRKKKFSLLCAKRAEWVQNEWTRWNAEKSNKIEEKRRKTGVHLYYVLDSSKIFSAKCTRFASHRRHIADLLLFNFTGIYKFGLMAFVCTLRYAHTFTFYNGHFLSPSSLLSFSFCIYTLACSVAAASLRNAKLCDECYFTTANCHHCNNKTY